MFGMIELLRQWKDRNGGDRGGCVGGTCFGAECNGLRELYDLSSQRHRSYVALFAAIVAATATVARCHSFCSSVVEIVDFFVLRCYFQCFLIHIQVTTVSLRC